MAIDTDKLKDDAAGILNLLGKITPGGKKGKRKKAANGGLIVDEDLTMMVDV